MIGETKILLGVLQLRRQFRAGLSAEEWVKRLSRLKIDWSILHLEQHDWCKLGVERLKILVRLVRSDQI